MKAFLIALGALTGIVCEFLLVNALVVANLWREGSEFTWIASIVIGLPFTFPAGLLASTGASHFYNRKVSPLPHRPDRRRSTITLSLAMMSAMTVCFTLDSVLVKSYVADYTYDFLRKNFKDKYPQFTKLSHDYIGDKGAKMTAEDSSVVGDAIGISTASITIDGHRRLWIPCMTPCYGGYVYLPKPPINVVKDLNSLSSRAKQHQEFEWLRGHWYLWYEPSTYGIDQVSDQDMAESYRSRRPQFKALGTFIESHPEIGTDELRVSNLENSKDGGAALTPLEESYAHVIRATGDLIDKTAEGVSKRYPQFVCQLGIDSVKGYIYLPSAPPSIAASLDEVENGRQVGTFYRPLGDKWYLFLEVG